MYQRANSTQQCNVSEVGHAFPVKGVMFCFSLLRHFSTKNRPFFSPLDFSLELQQTLKPNLKDSVIQEYAKLEQQMELSFRGETKNWRQGNAKKSFIYMLIDPRIS